MPQALGDWLKTKMPMPEFWNAVLCLGFYTASRVAEQVRSGIQSIPKGQTNAALAMGNFGGYSPFLAAWSPFLLFLLIGETVLIRTEE